MLSYDKVMVKCRDNQTQLYRIRGEMKRHIWVRDNDLVIVTLWDFQSDTRRARLHYLEVYRAQAEELKRKEEIQRGVSSA